LTRGLHRGKQRLPGSDHWEINRIPPMHFVVVFQGLTKLFDGAGRLEKEIFVGMSLPFAILALISLVKNRNSALLWSIVGCILVQLMFLDGYDMAHHGFRVVGLIDELNRKDLSGLLINPQTGQAFPIFVYFSFVPYLMAIGLHLVGISAYVAMKLTLALLLIFFCGGLHLLLKRNCELQKRPGDLNFQLLIVSLFMCSTCVYGLWPLTDELGEIAIYAFIPWIVLSLISGQPIYKLAILFFIQLIVHPVVFGHALLCEIALAYGISNLELWSIIRKMALPALAALIVATAFWLPQILWVHLIAGNAVIPNSFFNTFMGVRLMFSPTYDWTMGPWLILAVALLVIVTRGRMDKQAWVLVAAFGLTLAMQTIYLRGLVMLIPGISIFQFIFRFMIPAAFIALGVLVGFLSPEKRSTRIALSVLLGLAFLNMFVLRIVHIGRTVVPYVYDTPGYANYLVSDNAYGVAMLLPNYKSLPVDCTHAQAKDLQKVSFDNLLNGYRPAAAYVSVANAPIGIVSYRADGVPLTPAACGSDLILGPVPAGKTILADDGMLRKLSYVRLVSMLCALLLFVVGPAMGSRLRRRNAARSATDGLAVTR
jgi:hypothetical protein